MRTLREWAPMALMMLITLGLGTQILRSTPTKSRAGALFQGYPSATVITPPPTPLSPYVTPNTATPTGTATNTPTASATGTATGGTATPTGLTSTPTVDTPTATETPTDDVAPTSAPIETPTTDPLATATPDPFAVPTFPTADLTAEALAGADQPTSEPTVSPSITLTPTPEGIPISCPAGSVAEIGGEARPGAGLLVYLNNKVAGSGFVQPDGFFRIALAIERLRPGNYPLIVRDRETQARVGVFYCAIGEVTPTPIAVTPGTSSSEGGSQVLCLFGQGIQVTGIGRPRYALVVSFGDRKISGGTVLEDGTYSLPLTFEERRSGLYRVIVSERESRTVLTRFTCVVPITPTITPRNDRP